MRAREKQLNIHMKSLKIIRKELAHFSEKSGLTVVDERNLIYHFVVQRFSRNMTSNHI